MPVPRDHAIAIHMRRILERRWIDTRHVDLGSVNGVAYVRGELRRSPAFPRVPGGDLAGDDELLSLALERDLRAIPGVKDVSIDLYSHGSEERQCQPSRSRTA